MASEAERPVVLAKVATEAEAAMIVQALAGAGIEARAVGGFTSGFRAEVPGQVQVLVREEDVAAARKILEEE